MYTYNGICKPFLISINNMILYHDRSFPHHPALPCPPPPTTIKMSRKLITPIARETICYSKYREVCDIISMTIHAAV